jgi:ADP-ribose pyrophosphatase YjhB (NUDIX family)
MTHKKRLSERMAGKLPREIYYKIYSLVPRLCVDIIIKYKGGFVLVKREIPPCKGMWHIPGGTVLLGEKLEDTAKRVAKEETNLKVRIIKQLGVKEYSKKSAFGQAVSIVYLTEAVGGKLKGNEYGNEVKFFKEIPRKTIAEQAEMLQEVKIREH